MSDSYNSTDDERESVGAGTRAQYRRLSDDEQTQMVNIKQMMQDFIDYCDHVRQLSKDQGKDNGREMAIAITKAEEASMWAVKGITK